jgi:hypothetical protein
MSFWYGKNHFHTKNHCVHGNKCTSIEVIHVDEITIGIVGHQIKRLPGRLPTARWGTRWIRKRALKKSRRDDPQRRHLNTHLPTRKFHQSLTSILLITYTHTQCCFHDIEPRTRVRVGDSSSSCHAYHIIMPGLLIGYWVSRTLRRFKFSRNRYLQTLPCLRNLQHVCSFAKSQKAKAVCRFSYLHPNDGFRTIKPRRLDLD